MNIVEHSIKKYNVNMKRVKLSIQWIFFAIACLVPVIEIGTFCFGYSLEIKRELGFSIVLMLTSICVVVWNSVCKNNNGNKGAIIMALITPLSLFNVWIIAFDNFNIWVVLSLWISAGCSYFLTVKYGKPVVLKIITLVLSVLITVPIVVFTITGIVFNDFGRVTVVKTIESPNGNCYAQVIDNDKGALGGDTIVDVYEKKEFDGVVFKIYKTPKTVYTGSWGEYENMNISWENDDCIVINSKEYEIK